MFQYLKADLYRMRKERLSLISFALLILFSLIFAYSCRQDASSSGLSDALLAWSSLLPLFFLNPAKIFWGEDLTTRTINIMLIKSRNRLKVFIYKWLASLLLCVVYIVLAYGITAVAHGIFSGDYHFGILVRYFLYQLPLYLVVASLCNVFFTFFKRLYQSYIVYILIALMFDQLFTMLVVLLFKTDILVPYMMFTQIGLVNIMGSYLTPTVAVALLFSLIYAGIGFAIFRNREFK